ncbi:hypothetical protein [Burkholderia ubonensis]|uniref:hypothetical protein n=1 Tax=Burkholderia ubonensis TaxID=101571 RepID=UPI0018DF7C0B|nr:hypothetical protein [Burkholderia ubonensis]
MKRLVMLQALLAFAVFVLATALVSGRAQAVTPRETASSAEVGGVAAVGLSQPPEQPQARGCFCWRSIAEACNKKTRKAKPGGVLL